MRHMTISEFMERFEQDDLPHVIDVREPDEFETFNVGAVSLPLSKIREMDLEAIDHWGTDEEIIIHCNSGKRSLEACLLLETMGYSNLVNFKDHVNDLKEALGGRKLA